MVDKQTIALKPLKELGAYFQKTRGSLATRGNASV